MANEGKRSKGRFLYLFDWHAKSRKKLFSNKSESFDGEGSSQGNESVDNFANSPYLLRELSENGNHSSFRGSGNYSCVSSIDGDDGYGSKAPGVVARLMGLDSMPATTSCESSSFASYEPLAVGSSYYSGGVAPFELERHFSHHGYRYASDRIEGFPWNSADSRTNKVHGRPLERFQSEVLPPKSAKPISITHHKLLSPIKSPGFIPTKDAASIMEAASRIIDPSPQSSGRTKLPSLGSPSSSFRYHDLKDKIDAAQRSSRLYESSRTPKLSAPVQQVRGTASDRPSRRSLFKNIMSSQTNGSSKAKGKGKSVPLAAQDKVNVQKKDGSAHSDTRSQHQRDRKRLKQKEPNTQKIVPSRNPRKKSSSVLRQNNEKQNSVSHKGHVTAKTSVPDQQLRKISSGGNSAGPSKIVSKVFVNAEYKSKKVGTTSLTDRKPPLNGATEKRPALNKMKNISRSKQLSAKDNRLAEEVQENSSDRSVQHDLSLQGTSRRDMDVISFTFTSPIKKTGSQSLPTTTENLRSSHHHLCADSCGNGLSNMSSPPRGLKLVDSGSISLLLEQKLRELTDKIGSTASDSMMEGPGNNAVSHLSESNLSYDAVAPLEEYDDWSDKDQTSATWDDDCSSSIITKSSQNWEDFEGIEEHSASSTSRFEVCEESQHGHLNMSIPECSMSGSWMSSTTASDITHGNDQPSSPQYQEVTSCISNESVHRREDESDFTDASYWELEYVRHVLHYAGLKRLEMNEDCQNIDPSLFELLENLINTSSRNAEPCSKLERKILFGCVTESVNAKYQRTFLGSYKSWAKWVMLLQNDWLTEEVYKEIISWQNMGNLMVDELVDVDMSTQYGRWLDFEIESLEEGIEIEKEIVDSLVDELVADLIV